MSGSVPDVRRRITGFAPLRGALMLTALAAAGCAYSFSSGLPSHIRTVAVPVFANETSEFGVAEEITDQLVAGLVRDGTLRVVSDEAEASAVIVGTVRTYAEEPSGYTREERVEQYSIRITITVRFYDQVRDEVLWESERVFGTSLYENRGPEYRTNGREAAISQVVEEVLSGVVAGW